MAEQTQSKKKPAGCMRKIDKTTAECVKIIGKTGAGCVNLSKKGFHSRKVKKCFVILGIIFILACMAFGETALKKMSGNGPIWPELSNGIKNVVFCDGVVFGVSAWLFIIIASGAIGGMINHAYLNLKIFKAENIFKDKKKEHDEHYSLLNFMLIGAGGALCVSWFKIAIMTQDEYPGVLSVGNIFTVLAWSFVAGLFAFPLIELIQKKFMAAMSKDEIANIVDSKVEDVEKEVKDTKIYNRLLTEAHTSLNSKDKRDMATTTREIEDNIDLFPIDRPLHIYLGRLYRWQLKFDEAIFTLRKFVKKRLQRENSEGLNSGDKEALATAFFNISCYHCLKAHNFENSPKEFNRLLNEALVALEEVEQYSYELAKTALKDPDMKLLRDKKYDSLKKYNEEI